MIAVSACGCCAKHQAMLAWLGGTCCRVSGRSLPSAVIEGAPTPVFYAQMLVPQTAMTRPQNSQV